MIPQQSARTEPSQPDAKPTAAITTAKPSAELQAKATAATGATADHSLRLEFDEDAWIEIKDGEDKVLTSRMHTAGSLVRVAGKSPLDVTIGNAHAVRLFDNGKSINLTRYTTADVARIKLK
jgi:cytoskeleton protein RodZ